MRHMLLRIALFASAALLVTVGVAAASGSFVSAKSKLNKSEVRLCLNYTTGKVRAPRLNHCKKNEKFVTVRQAKPGPGVKTTAGLAGPQGPAGPQGAAGANGATGPKGAIGPQGPKGDPGAAGTDGVDGAPGAEGPAGPQGPKGDAGATGAAGANGTDGTPGLQGPAGPQGATGPMGPQGPKGDTGASGAQGPQGPAGPAGAQGPAVSTATAWVCVNTSSGEMKWSSSSSCNGNATAYQIYIAP